MPAIPFGCLLWKEYRVHRSLWLLCLVLGFLLQVVVGFAVAKVDLERTWNALSTPRLFALMYAIGCAAMLFALEREERTCDWLLNISVPPILMLTAKFVFAILSTVVLQYLLGLISLALRIGFLPEDFVNRLDAFDIRSASGGLLVIPHWLVDSTSLIVLSFAFFGSLLSRRVMTSIVAMVLWSVVTLIIPLMIFEYVVATFWPSAVVENLAILRTRVIIVSCFVVTVMNIRVGWLWCQGRFLDGSILDRLNDWMSAPVLALRSQALWRPQISAEVEFEQPWRRTWQRLVWCERKRDSFHILFPICVCVVGFILAVMDHFIRFQTSGGGLQAQTIHYGDFTLLLCLATPIVMGVVGFESDANQDRSRFLANRGIAPGSMWMAKQAVWLGRAFWITALVFLICFFFEWLLVPKPVAQLDTSLRPAQRTFESVFNKIRNEYDFAIWYVLLTYSCSQLTSMLFRRTVIAFIFGVVFSSVTSSWMMCVDGLSVPRWWSLGFPAVAMLSMTLWQMRARMLDDRSWSNRLKLYSALVATPVVLLIAFASYRLNEVTALPKLDGKLGSAWESSLAVLKNPPRPSSIEMNLADRIDSLTGPSRQRVTGAEIVELMKSELQSINVKFMSQRASNVWTLTTGILTDANNSTEAGKLDEALEDYLACLKLARVTAAPGQIDGMWSRGTASQSITLEFIVNWANHPSQTPDSIRVAMKSIESELARFPSATGAVVESYLKDLRITEPLSYDDYVEWQTGLQLVGHTAFEVTGLSIQPWERKRLRTLMTREAELVFAEIAALEARLAEFPGAQSTASDSVLASLQRLQISPQMKPASNASERIKALVLQRETEIRAALTRMALIAYRLEHDRLPDRLLELMDNFDGRRLVDPWSDRIFDFYPTVLLSARPVSINPSGATVALLPASQTTVAIDCAYCRGNFRLWFKSVLSDSVTIVPKPSILSAGQGPVGAHSWMFGIPIWPHTTIDQIDEPGEPVDPQEKVTKKLQPDRPSVAPDPTKPDDVD